MTTLIELSKFYKTLPKKELLIGLKVYDKYNDEYIYIKDVESGIWAGTNLDNKQGNYYNIGSLLIENI